MSVLMYRVDERLIHGQVVVGWGSSLRPERIVVVDDVLADSPWEQELYAMGVPAEMEAEFESVASALDRLPAWQEGSERVLLLTRNIGTMMSLARSGLLRDVEVNIGGIHHAPGRSQILRYVFLSDGERRELEALSEQGVRVVARDVPGARGVELEDLVRAP